MDIIILGLLMIQNCTIYEMKKVIEKNFGNISSSSIGSMQAAVKKLLSKNMICFNEHVENSVNKKVYEITHEGTGTLPLHYFRAYALQGKKHGVE